MTFHSESSESWFMINKYLKMHSLKNFDTSSSLQNRSSRNGCVQVREHLPSAEVTVTWWVEEVPKLDQA